MWASTNGGLPTFSLLPCCRVTHVLHHISFEREAQRDGGHGNDSETFDDRHMKDVTCKKLTPEPIKLS